MTEEEMRAALEECIRVCNSLLNALRDHSIPMEENVSAARFRVWTVSEVIDENRRRLDRYEQQRDSLERAARTLEADLARSYARVTELRSRQEDLRRELDTVQAQLEELRTGQEKWQQELDARQQQLDAADQDRQTEEKAPSAASPGKKKEEEDAHSGDDPALFSTLQLQNRIALGLR